MQYKTIWAVINGGSGGISERVEMVFYDKYDADTYATELRKQGILKQYAVVEMTICEMD